MTSAVDSLPAPARMDLQGDTLRIDGQLQRDAVPALWAMLPQAPIARIDLSAVTALDTSGLALLVELAAHARRTGGPTPAILHAPAGYDALCAAYRIRPTLE